MSDGSDVILSIVSESVAGVTPATPAFKSIRTTGESLVANFETLVSNEINPNADVSNVRRTGVTVSGEVNFELHRDVGFEDLIAAAFRGTWASNVLKAAKTKPKFTMERKITADDGSSSYFRFLGSRIGGITLSFSPEEIITGSLSVTGTGHTASASAIAGATYASPSPPETTPPMTGLDVTSIALSGVTGVDYQNLTVELQNNLRIQKKLAASNGAARGVGYGRRNITGTLVAYFETLDAYNAFLNNSSPSITVACTDGTNTYTLVIPRIIITGGDVPSSGNDTDIMLTLNWQAIFDNTLSTAIQLTRSAMA